MNIYKSIKFILLNLIYLFGIFFISLEVYLERYFGEVSLGQILFHLKISTWGLIDSEEYILIKFLQLCIFFPIIALLLSNFLYLYLKRSNKTIFTKIQSSNNLNFFISILFLVVSIIFLSKTVSIGNIFYKDDIIKKYYISPNNVSFKIDQESKNLILIYAESYENSFSDKKIFKEDLIEILKNENLNGTSFKNFIQTPLTNWTIAAIVSTQCGVPLKNYGIFNFGKQKGKHLRQVFGMKEFLPNITCLGDILKENNYSNIFINSPNLNFSGTGKFFKTHGYDEIYGKNEYKNNNLNFSGSSWGGGPNDKFLFDFAKTKIEELFVSKKKFNITILTTDTHEPNGFIDPKCNIKNEGLSSVVKCSSKTIYDFIKEINEIYGDKVKIIVLGDHYFRFNEEIRKKINKKNRSLYNSFIFSNDMKILRKDAIHYDFFPSILEYMDIKSDSSKLGMGVSGFKPFNEKEYQSRKNDIIKNVQNNSKFYKNFWIK